ncbi:chaperone [Lithospermum erythrorhizon]|uniref:Chaperone n=1 Tax=Lithospermum erythrorhizon TaxID=34254 RepID=A0AAV3PI97_LITER
MADKHDVEGSSSSSVIDGGSDSTVELNVKTLDSQNYHFNVDKNITVSAFKEKIASQTGLPVVQQRLIFRGKVLKDNDLLSDYHVESGHTLHLVERQPAQPQHSSGATSGFTNTNDGNGDSGQEPGAAGPRIRIGQSSHSVMLGSLNVGDQGEGAVPDISRVIGAVLSSIGLGSQIGGGMPGMQFSGPATTPQGNESEGSRNGTGTQAEAGNQSFNGQPFIGPSIPQAVQIPVGAAIAIPTLNIPIPDSLTTLSEFMSRMEQAFGQNENANQSPDNTGELPRAVLPANSNGGATLEGLSIVLRQAERLISGRAVAALSHIASRLEQEAGSTDISVRGQIQAESGRLGLEMQHLGALFLELGRTILTTRMGRSLAESSVNSGPAVYISPTGPNPIMVQPFPLQTGSLFGSSSSAPVNPAMFGPTSGNIPRNVNIHIHAVGMRGTNGQGSLGDRTNGSGDSGQTRDIPMRNVTTTATPSQPATFSISSGVPASQPPASSLSTAVSELNAQLRYLVDTMPSELRMPQDQSEISNVDGRSAGNDANENSPGDGSNDAVAERGQKAHDQELRPGGTDNAEGFVNFKEPSSSSAESSNNLTGSSEFSADGASQSSQVDHQGSSATPLGLGLGGLQPKRRSRQSKVQAKSGATSSQEQSRAVGQQVLQTLASLGNRQSTENVPGVSLPTSSSSVIDCIPAGLHDTNGQLDIGNTMSQVLQSPALGGLLAGVSQQTGIGSPNALRNMMEQLTQNPAMRNTVNQIAQQIDGHDLGSMFSGMASGQGGGIDLSRMMQQMMPIVSQALGGSSSFGQSMPSTETQRLQSMPRRDVPPAPTMTQVDLQQVTRRIEERSPPQEIFRSLIENAVNLNGVSNQETSLNELSSEDGLVNEFMHMLCQDVSRRLDS